MGCGGEWRGNSWLKESYICYIGRPNRKMASLLPTRHVKAKQPPTHHHPTQADTKNNGRGEPFPREQRPLSRVLHRSRSLKQFFDPHPHPHPQPSKLPIQSNLQSPKSPHSINYTSYPQPNEGNLRRKKEVFTPAQDEYCITPNPHISKPSAASLRESSATQKKAAGEKRLKKGVVEGGGVGDKQNTRLKNSQPSPYLFSDYQNVPMISSVYVSGSKLGSPRPESLGDYLICEKLSPQKMSKIMNEIRMQKRKMSKLRSSSETCRSSERHMLPKVTKNVFSPRKQTVRSQVKSQKSLYFTFGI